MEDLQDYALMTEAYDFSVSFDACKGKFLQARRALESEETILVEVPLICWPIGASVPLSEAVFCENCLKLKPFQSPSAPGVSSPSPSPHRPELGPAPVDAGLASPHTTCLLPGDTSPSGSHTASQIDTQLSPSLSSGASSSSPVASSLEEGCELTVDGVLCWFCSTPCLANALGGDSLLSLHKALPSSAETPVARALAAAACASVGVSLEGGKKRRGVPAEVGEKRKLHGGVDAKTARTGAAAPEECAEVDSGSEEATVACRDAGKDDRDKKLVGGWMSVLGPASLRLLRENTETHASTSNPLPSEALARAIARIAAQTRALLLAHPGLSLGEAFAAASRPFQRLAVPAETPAGFDFSAILAAVKSERELLSAVLAKRLQATVGSEAAGVLLHSDTLVHLRSALSVNSQAIHLWGASTAGALMVLRAGGVYTLHACANHSCDPNCGVSSSGSEGGGSTLSVATLRAVAPGEELTVSYVDISLPLKARREMLLSSFGFLCRCSKCMREAEAAAPEAAPVDAEM
ncbi:putative histone lysine methyltransferase, SET [Toxoplasma gondii ARI]|uniref:Putative histone lysine methyltransferase, SET n=1 Tax=Toxoplasma gondii ARI TaxID=1074872 RepID=A0A139XPK6_TOXGO|nr:putative histone lysine methyltransferase, SET [Toxoplasma gondii ARI]